MPYDNPVMEFFFSSLKRKELYRKELYRAIYRSENEFRTAVKNYILFYKEKGLTQNRSKTPHRESENLNFSVDKVKKLNN